MTDKIFATIGGRDMEVQAPTGDQLALLARELRVISSYTSGDEDNIVRRIARAYNILESIVVEEDDKDYLSDLVSTRKLGLSDLAEALKAVAPPEVKKPAVSRANPRRTRA